MGLQEYSEVMDPLRGGKMPFEIIDAGDGKFVKAWIPYCLVIVLAGIALVILWS